MYLKHAILCISCFLW